MRTTRLTIGDAFMDEIQIMNEIVYGYILTKIFVGMDAQIFSLF
jgi:hypothetical protein